MDGGAAVPSVVPMTTPTAMPASFNAGTTLYYERPAPDLPASTHGWKLSLFIAGPGTGECKDVALTNGVYPLQLAADVTAALPPGAYRYTERAVENAPGVRVFDVGAGNVIVEPDLAAATSGSAMSYEAQVLVALKDKLLGRLTKDQEQLQVGDTMISRIPFEKLEELIAKYQTIVDLQQSPNAAIGSVEISFVRPS